VPPIDWNDAIRCAKLALIAESIPPAGDADQLKGALKKAGYTYLDTLYGNKLSPDIDPPSGEIMSLGFLALSSSHELVASIRGTPTVLEWVDDAAFRLVPSSIPGVTGSTEAGFTAIYNSLRTGTEVGSNAVVAAIKSHLTRGAARTVTVCGHGLGGALATLLAVDLAVNTPCKNPAAYTFGSPRTGDFPFAQAYNSSVPASYRIVNRQDSVPQLPLYPPLPYEHVNTEYELTPPFGRVKQTLACMHHLTTYIWLMRLLGNPLNVNHSLLASAT
jgi:hypothetical protein